MFSACAPDEQFVQSAPSQGLKPILVQISTARLSRFHYTAVMYGLEAVPFREASFSAARKAVPFVWIGY